MEGICVKLARLSLPTCPTHYQHEGGGGGGERELVAAAETLPSIHKQARWNNIPFSSAAVRSSLSGTVVAAADSAQETQDRRSRKGFLALS